MANGAGGTSFRFAPEAEAPRRTKLEIENYDM
jgi:hypothetical protein